MANVGRMVKESMVQELSTRLAGRSSLFITRINRLPASGADSLRQKLSSSNADLVMVKRRLGKRALASLKVPDLDGLLEGSVGLVLPGGDVLSIAKLLIDFVKAHEEQLAVSGAWIDGQLLDTNRVKELASLPPKPMLLAQVVATIESPLADVIFTLERLIGDIAWLAEQAAAAKPLPAASEAAASKDGPPTTEAGTPPPGGVVEGSPDAVPRQDSGRRPEEPRDAAGGGTQPSEPQNPKLEEGTPS